MKKETIIILVLISIIACCAFMFLERQKNFLAEINAIGDQKAEISRLTNKLAKQEQEKQQLEEELAAIENVVPTPETAPNPLAAIMENMEVPEDFDPAALLEQMIPDDEKKGSMSGMMDMFKGEEGKKMRDMSARMAVNMQYADLFTELGLDPEREDALKALIMEQLSKQMEVGMGAMEGGFDAEAMVAAQEKAEAEMAAEVKKILGPDEFAQYEEYEAYKEERMLEQSLEMQLGMFGGAGLTAENKAMTIDTIIEEFQVLQSDKANAAQMMTNPLQMYENALERLEGSMEPDQLAHVENFVEQQRDMMETMAEMMGSEFGELLGVSNESE